MIDAIHSVVEHNGELKKTLFATGAERIAAGARETCSAPESGRKVLRLDNGGRAAEFVRRFLKERRPRRVLALTSDPSILTGIGNHCGCDRIFVRRIQAPGKPGAVAIAISTSGNSPDVLLAVQAADEPGLDTVGLTVREDGRRGGIVGHHLHVTHHSTARVREMCICASWWATA